MALSPRMWGWTYTEGATDNWPYIVPTHVGVDLILLLTLYPSPISCTYAHACPSSTLRFYLIESNRVSAQSMWM